MPLALFQLNLGLNFMREIKRDVQKYTLESSIQSAVITQAGTPGIENIKPPIRLFFIPYVSAYYQQDDCSR
jgi:hypothetical protein